MGRKQAFFSFPTDLKGQRAYVHAILGEAIRTLEAKQGRINEQTTEDALLTLVRQLHASAGPLMMDAAFRVRLPWTRHASAKKLADDIKPAMLELRAQYVADKIDDAGIDAAIRKLAQQQLRIYVGRAKKEAVRMSVPAKPLDEQSLQLVKHRLLTEKTAVNAAQLLAAILYGVGSDRRLRDKRIRGTPLFDPDAEIPWFPSASSRRKSR